MEVKDMVDARTLAPQLIGTNNVVTRILVKPGLKPGRWRVLLVDGNGQTVHARSVVKAVPVMKVEMSFELERPISWETARRSTIGFERMPAEPTDAPTQKAS